MCFYNVAFAVRKTVLENSVSLFLHTIYLLITFQNIWFLSDCHEALR